MPKKAKKKTEETAQEDVESSSKSESKETKKTKSKAKGFELVLNRSVALGKGTRERGEVAGTCEVQEPTLEEVDFVDGFNEKEQKTLMTNPHLYSVKPK